MACTVTQKLHAVLQYCVQVLLKNARIGLSDMAWERFLLKNSHWPRSALVERELHSGLSSKTDFESLW